MDTDTPVNNTSISDNAATATATATPPAAPANGEMSDADVRAVLEGMSNDQLLDLFAEQMMIDKGLRDEVDADVFSVLKDDLKDRLAMQINRAILVQLPDAKLEQLEKDLDANTATADGFEKMAAESGVDIEKTTQDVMMAFRNTYLGLPVEG